MNYSKICLVSGTTCDSVTGSSFAPPRKTINNELNQFADVLPNIGQFSARVRPLLTSSPISGQVFVEKSGLLTSSPSRGALEATLLQF